MQNGRTIRVLNYTGSVQALLKHGKHVHIVDDKMFPDCHYFWTFDKPVSQYLNELEIRGNGIYNGREMVARIEEHDPKHT